MNCQYCGREFKRSGLPGHERACKRAKPRDRQEHQERGRWHRQRDNRSNFVPINGSHFRQSIANLKIYDSNN